MPAVRILILLELFEEPSCSNPTSRLLALFCRTYSPPFSYAQAQASASTARRHRWPGSRTRPRIPRAITTQPGDRDRRRRRAGQTTPGAKPHTTASIPRCCSPTWRRCSRTHPQAVLVYTNTYDHRRVVEICARHGVHVMMEKPLAVSLDDALAIEKAARGQDSRAGQLRDDLVPQQSRRLRSGSRRRAGRHPQSGVHDGQTARRKSASSPSFSRGSPIPNSTAPAHCSISDATAPT